VHLAFPGISLCQHHDPVLFSTMLADQNGAGLEPECIIKLEIGSPVPGSEFLGQALKEALKRR